jgi:SAM-dependent methyltransferase
VNSGTSNGRRAVPQNGLKAQEILLSLGKQRNTCPKAVESWKEVVAKDSMSICWKNQVFQLLALILQKKTVKNINELYPSLDIRFGDIRNMDFDNGFFDGYWSFGVIEHFYDGYDDVVIEMCKVLRPQGYLFMTVPTMSPLRKYLSQKGKYPLWEDANQDVDKFYQFALDANKIVIDFENAGFKLCEMRPYGGLKGFKDEVTFLKPLLQPVFDNQNIFVKAIKIFLDFVFQPIAAHTTLFVFQKK